MCFRCEIPGGLIWDSVNNRCHALAVPRGIPRSLDHKKSGGVAEVFVCFREEARHHSTVSKHSKHSVCLLQAMLNFLSLLGWNDGTEQEIYNPEELQQKFSLERITKSAAVFDKTKLSWMNGG